MIIPLRRRLEISVAHGGIFRPFETEINPAIPIEDNIKVTREGEPVRSGREEVTASAHRRGRPSNRLLNA